MLCSLLLLLSGCGITQLFPSLSLPDGEQSQTSGEDGYYEDEAPEAENTLVIWYTTENDFSDLLEALTEKYNKLGVITAQLRAFETETELARALNYSRPDLLLCASNIAMGLWNNGNLCRLGTNAEFIPALCAQSESIGRGYFPFGISAQVLLVNTSLALELAGGEIPTGLFSSLENIMNLSSDFPREDGISLIAAENFADVFSAYMTAAGDEFTGLRENDINSSCYGKLYNYFAEGAYKGSVSLDSSAAQAVIEGRCVCAFVSSLDIPALNDSCTVMPMPDFAGVKPCSVGIADGLAVCCENPARYNAIVDYLNYIFSLDSSAEVEALGRVSTGSFGGDNFSRIGGRDSIRLSLPSSENELSISIFDSWFRKMLTVLK